MPALATLNQPSFWLFLIGLALTIILLVCKVKGAILIGIVATALLGIPMGVTVTTETVSFTEACSQLPTTFGAIFTSEGLPSLFSDVSKLPLVLVTIFSFSLSDTFDTIGTFIGTGRRTGIFSEEDERSMETTAGFHSKMDRALFADSIATSIGAILGTSNTTTYVESAAGIGAGGRTGLTSVVVSLCFAISAFLATFVSAIPFAATAPALVVVGIMMMSAFREIQWDDFDEAVPAYFAGVFMAICYSISYGIAAGFIFYCITKILQKAGQTDPPDPLGCDHPVCHQLCPAGHHLTQHGKKKTARPPLPARREGRAFFSLKKRAAREFCSRAALHVFLLTAIRLDFSG